MKGCVCVGEMKKMKKNRMKTREYKSKNEIREQERKQEMNQEENEREEKNMVVETITLKT